MDGQLPQGQGVSPAPPQPVQLVPNNGFLQYMHLNTEFMSGINRQLETSEIVSQIHTFNGNNAASYRLWMKHLRRAALERQPHDDLYMRKLVSRTVKDSASDFWTEIRTENPDITWTEIQASFRERFSNYVDAQIALQKVTKLKQERKQTLHYFAQKIIETAREAYSEEDYASPIVTRQIRELFIDGIKCHKTSQLLIRENVADLPRDLNRAVRQELLLQTYRLREVDTIDDQGRNVEKMEVDALDFELENNEEAPATQKQFQGLADSIAAIATNF